MQLYQFPTPEEQVASLADQIAQVLTNTITTNGRATLAVSGGKSPIKLFSELSKKELPWDKVTITLVDERFLATDHEDSNENLVRKYLLINNAEQAFFTGLVTTRNIVYSTANANLQIDNIDVAILGMGEDGHTASIFPCCDELDTVLDTQLSVERYVITNPKTANYQRIGLSLNGILNVKHIFVSINGSKKLDIIQEAAKGATKQYPISYVLAERNDTQIFWHN